MRVNTYDLSEDWLKGKRLPKRVHHISTVPELSGISHIREGWNIQELDSNDLMGTFIEKHKVTLSNCITKNSSDGRVRAGQNTSDYSLQHNPALKGDRTKQKQTKAEENSSVSRAEFEVGEVHGKTASEEPITYSRGQRGNVTLLLNMQQLKDQLEL